MVYIKKKKKRQRQRGKGRQINIYFFILQAKKTLTKKLTTSILCVVGEREANWFTCNKTEINFVNIQ